MGTMGKVRTSERGGPPSPTTLSRGGIGRGEGSQERGEQGVGRRNGDVETKGGGDEEIGRGGDRETWRQRNKETGRDGDVATWRRRCCDGLR